MKLSDRFYMATPPGGMFEVRDGGNTLEWWNGEEYIWNEDEERYERSDPPHEYRLYFFVGCEYLHVEIGAECETGTWAPQ